MEEDLLWEKVLKRIKKNINMIQYTTWFEPTELRKINDNKLVIIVPTEIHKKHLFNNYYDMIINNLLKETKDIDEVSFTLEEELDNIEDIGYVARHGMI